MSILSDRTIRARIIAIVNCRLFSNRIAHFYLAANQPCGHLITRNMPNRSLPRYMPMVGEVEAAGTIQQSSMTICWIDPGAEGSVTRVVEGCLPGTKISIPAYGISACICICIDVTALCNMGTTASSHTVGMRASRTTTSMNRPL
jgi:hypothetical protein